MLARSNSPVHVGRSTSFTRRLVAWSASGFSAATVSKMRESGATLSLSCRRRPAPTTGWSLAAVKLGDDHIAHSDPFFVVFLFTVFTFCGNGALVLAEGFVDRTAIPQRNGDACRYGQHRVASIVRLLAVDPHARVVAIRAHENVRYAARGLSEHRAYRNGHLDGGHVFQGEHPRRRHGCQAHLVDSRRGFFRFSVNEGVLRRDHRAGGVCWERRRSERSEEEAPHARHRALLRAADVLDDLLKNLSRIVRAS
eukprot:scaffold33_cov135-Pinguiococcus_pyrenoidosus.AAC.7